MRFQVYDLGFGIFLPLKSWQISVGKTQRHLNIDPPDNFCHLCAKAKHRRWAQLHFKYFNLFFFVRNRDINKKESSIDNS